MQNLDIKVMHIYLCTICIIVALLDLAAFVLLNAVFHNEIHSRDINIR